MAITFLGEILNTAWWGRFYRGVTANRHVERGDELLTLRTPTETNPNTQTTTEWYEEFRTQRYTPALSRMSSLRQDSSTSLRFWNSFPTEESGVVRSQFIPQVAINEQQTGVKSWTQPTACSSTNRGLMCSGNSICDALGSGYREHWLSKTFLVPSSRFCTPHKHFYLQLLSYTSLESGKNWDFVNYRIFRDIVEFCSNVHRSHKASRATVHESEFNE